MTTFKGAFDAVKLLQGLVDIGLVVAQSQAQISTTLQRAWEEKRDVSDAELEQLRAVNAALHQQVMAALNQAARQSADT